MMGDSLPHLWEAAAENTVAKPRRVLVSCSSTMLSREKCTSMTARLISDQFNLLASLDGDARKVEEEEDEGQPVLRGIAQCSSQVGHDAAFSPHPPRHRSLLSQHTLKMRLHNERKPCIESEVILCSRRACIRVLIPSSIDLIRRPAIRSSAASVIDPVMSIS